MPFDDLTKTQRDFIVKYFKTGKRYKKNKKAQFNEDLKYATFEVYNRINMFKLRIDKIKEDHPHLSVQVLYEKLATISSFADATLENNKRNMKENMEVPDFSRVQSMLNEFSREISDYLTRMRELEGTLKGDKLSAADEALKRCDEYHEAAYETFREARREMETAAQEDITALETEIAKFDQLEDVIRKAIMTAIGTEGEDPSVDLETFEELVYGKPDLFVERGDVFVAEVIRLMQKRIGNYTREMTSNERYKNLPVVKREAERGRQVTAEIDKLGKAVTAQQTKIDELRNEFKEASPGDKEKIRQQILAKEAHLDDLKSRLAQCERYQETGAERAKRIIETERRLDTQSTLADKIAELLEDEFPAKIEEFDNRLEDESLSIVVLDNDRDVLARNAELLRQVETSLAREIISERVFPEETKLTEISSDQAALLTKMLANARKLVEEGRLDYASVVHFEVSRLWQFFVMQRRMGLPAAPPPPPKLDEVYRRELEVQEARARNFWAQGAPEASVLIGGCGDIRESIEQIVSTHDSVNPATERDYADVKSALSDLKEALDDITIPEREKSDEAKLAVAVSAKVTNKLVEMFNCKEIEVTEEDLEAGKFFEKNWRGKRVEVSSDRVMKVPDGTDEEGNPKFKYQLIDIKSGLVGGEEVLRRDEKHVPRDMMVFLKQRAESLAMMAETSAEGCEDAMKKYAEETEKLLDEIAEKGPDCYKRIDEIVKWCDNAMTSNPISKYLTNDYGEKKTDYDNFKKEYPKKLPTEAKADAEKQLRAIVKLQKDAEALRQTYKTVHATAMRIHWELSAVFDELSGESNSLGSGMEALIDGGIDRLLVKLKTEYQDSTDPEIIRRISEVEQLIKKSKGEFKTHKIPKNHIDGTWRKELLAAFRKLDSKTQPGIEAAETELEKLKQAMAKFETSLDTAGSATGEDLLKLVESFGSRISDVSTSSIEQAEAKKKMNKMRSQLKSDIKKLKAEVRKKSEKGWIFKSTENDILIQIKNRTDAAESKRKQTVTNAEEREGYEEAITELEALEQEVAEIARMLGSTDKIKAAKMYSAVGIGDLTTVSDKLPTLNAFLEKLEEKAKGLKAAEIEARLEASLKAIDEKLEKALEEAAEESEKPGIRTAHEKQKTDLRNAVNDVDSSLQQISNMFDASNLTSVARKIDQAIKDKDSETGTKATRITLREEALAELRWVRTLTDEHPVVKLYATNPFDQGVALNYLASAFHQVEVAILGCVSPKESK
ncbi:hypothetical protein LNKW23_14500 [Paralimibaculum aggregatum]|uniref:Uncharacterized protein n=1 Tax=Paralimibaculum aggregatum TaxID=3036245 RepID=A0ABQ6LKP7_9RHOB|nr:hypothetical protein [Limibaculum sp. NKW23]GMG82237.1 hypothetical protein LNKW23_14500 [Limibaculum sp. NKW23]